MDGNSFEKGNIVVSKLWEHKSSLLLKVCAYILINIYVFEKNRFLNMQIIKLNMYHDIVTLHVMHIMYRTFMQIQSILLIL